MRGEMRGRERRVLGPPSSKLRGADLSWRVGLGILLLVLVAVYVGPAVLPLDAYTQDLFNGLHPPSRTHWLGTDNLGRDLLARVLLAGRVDIQVGVLAAAINLAIGVTIGAATGYFGGWIDAIFMRVCDVTTAFPRMVLVIAIVAMLGPALFSIYIALCMVGWVFYARLVRGDVLVAKEQQYVLAARSIGAGDLRIISRHLLPNVVVAALVFATSNAVLNILFAASLSFVGLGVQPPDPEWGTMIAEGRAFMFDAPNLILFPGLAVAITGLGFTLLGEGLVDRLRPKR